MQKLPEVMEPDEVRVKVIQVGERISDVDRYMKAWVIRFDTGDRMYLSEKCPGMILKLWWDAEARIIQPPPQGFELDMEYFIGKEYIFNRTMRSCRAVPEVQDVMDLYKEIDDKFLEIMVEEDDIEETGKAGDQGGDWE